MNATKYPATVQELVRMAIERGVKPSELVFELEPFPEPPAGYTMSEECDGLWTAPEIEVAGMVIVPAWNYRNQEHYLELWTGKGTEDEEVAFLPPADAYNLALALISAAKTAETAAEAAGN